MLNVFNLFPDPLRIKGRYHYEEKIKVFFFWGFLDEFTLVLDSLELTV